MFEKLQKCKFETSNQGCALNSSESAAPLHLSSQTCTQVTKTNMLFLDRITAFADWDSPSKGHQDQLKQELELFAEGSAKTTALVDHSTFLIDMHHSFVAAQCLCQRFNVALKAVPTFER
mmetsp:Transcript_24971/g.34932  ORF Transcript_24971/g.34932 Transcript_24971/m.34932 type:complete len:120 (+) Transcript_24971:560-919(+)